MKIAIVFNNVVQTLVENVQKIEIDGQNYSVDGGLVHGLSSSAEFLIFNDDVALDSKQTITDAIRSQQLDKSQFNKVTNEDLQAQIQALQEQVQQLTQAQSTTEGGES